MNKQELNEQLSALVDDELRRDQTAFLLRRLSHDPGAAAQFGRYCLISDTLRRKLPPRVQFDLADRVSAALANEPVHQSRPSFFQHRLLRPVAGIAVAASVAALSVVLWPQPQGAIDGSRPAVASAGVSRPAPALHAVAQPVAHSAGQQWERLEPEVQRRLNGYLVDHGEHSSRAQIGGILTRVRVAGQQSAR